jgi:quercetin dioxygenase-like cupin family protein
MSPHYFGHDFRFPRGDARQHLSSPRAGQFGSEANYWANDEKELTVMEKDHIDSQVPMVVGGHPDRPLGAGTSTIAAHEKLPNLPGMSITLQVVDVPPGGRVPEHHHGGPTTDYMISGVLRMQMQGDAPRDYHPGEVLFEPEGATHLYAENLSSTEPAKVMLIHVANDGAKLINTHRRTG